jgi:hypothetical protein
MVFRSSPVTDAIPRKAGAQATGPSPSRFRFGLVGWLLLLPSALIFCAPPGGEDETALQVRRILLQPEQLELELKRLKEGVLVQMPRMEFEQKLRDAQRRLRRRPPVLTEARYRARLEDASLTGSGQWKVVHSGSGPDLLPLEPLNLALRQVRFENRDAVIGDFDGRTPALLIEDVGEHTAFIDWSARGEPRPDGLQFDLKFPPTPLGVLELDLPPDRVVVSLDATLVSGPHPAEAADRRLWKLFCGGRTQVNFVVRPSAAKEDMPPGAPGAPLVLVRQRNSQRLTPEGLEATIELTLDVGHPGLRRLVLVLDPELRLREVSAPDLEGYDVGVPPSGQPVPVTVRLRSPLREGTVVLSCLAPLEVAAKTEAKDDPARLITWRSPGVRLQGGAPRGETLELWLHPDLRVEGFQPGGFRLTTASAAPAKEASGQRLTLVGGGVESAKGDLGKRPQLRCRASGVDFSVRQLAWWEVDAEGMQLTEDLWYEVSHGRLFQLAVQVPTGWDVKSVKMTSNSRVRNWTVRAGKGSQVLHVELDRPLGPDSEVRLAAEEAILPPRTTRSGVVAASDTRGRMPLRVELKPARAEPLTGHDLPFPDAIPIGAHVRDAALAVRVDDAVYRSAVQTTAEPTEPDDDGVRGRTPPTYYYRFLSQPLAGHLRLETRQPQVRVRSETDVLVASGRAAVQTRLLLEAEAGVIESVDLHVTGRMPSPWTWRESSSEKEVSPPLAPPHAPLATRMEHRIAEEAAEGLAALAATTPIEAAVFAASRPAGQRWRLTLPRPLRTHEPMQLSAAGPLLAKDGVWAPPLLVVSGAHMEGEVTLHLGGAELVHVETAGLREGRGTSRRGSATAWRTYRYGPAGGAVLLKSPLSAAQPAEASVDRAVLTTYVGPDGLLQHHFLFRVSGWQENHLSVQLPAGARLRAAQVDGHWIPAATIPASAGELRLPVPLRVAAQESSTSQPGTSHASLWFEVLYTTPASHGWFLAEFEAPIPRLPIEPTSFRRCWRLPPDVIPLFGGQLQRMPGTGDAAAPVERDVSDLFRLPGTPQPWREAGPSLAHVQAIADAAQALRLPRPSAPDTHPPGTLGQVVEVVAFEHLRREFPLVVDTAALAEAGLSPATALPSPPEDRPRWEASGVVVTPAGTATLLTTARQLSAWRRAGGFLFGDTTHPDIPHGVVRAAAEAVQRGQDSSGRFRSAVLWLRPEATVEADAAEESPLHPGLDPTVWVEWAQVAGSDGTTLMVVQVGEVRTAAFFVTAVLVLAGWRLRRLHWRLRVTLLLMLLALAGVGLVWLPGSVRDLAWLPLVAGCVTALIWYLVAVRRDEAARRRTAATAAVGILTVILAGWGHLPITSARAAPEGPVTIYLLPAETEEKQRVLVPTDFLERLKTLSPPAASTGRKAVLLNAAYEGKVEEGAAEIYAAFAVHCTSDAPVPLLLPLDGVLLVDDVWLDGTRAHAIAVADGYTLKVKGVGRHKVELRFRTAIRNTVEDQSIAATLPPLLQSWLVFRLPPGAAFSQAVAHGAVRETVNGAGKLLEADLGPIKALQVRWFTEKPGVVSRVEFRAAHLWDLRLEGSTLLSLVRYQISQAPITELDVLLPPGLEVQSVALSRPQGAERSASVPRLRERRVEDRRLRLLFAAPVAGALDVFLELTPRGALPATVVLPLPVPQGTPLPGDSYLAYRLQGLEARRGQLLGVTGIRAEEFAPFWPSASRPEPRDLAYACTVAPNALLELHLLHPDPVVDVIQEVRIQAGLRQLHLRASATLRNPNRDLAVVEWELHGSQPLTVLRVAGPNVRSWTQTGERVVIWLSRTAEKVDLELLAWAPLAPLAGRPPGESRLDLPCLRLHPARSQQTTLRLVGTSDVVPAPLEGAGPRHLDPIPAQPGDAERVYRTAAKDYGGSFVLRPVGNDPPEVKSMTLVEVHDHKLGFTATLECRPSRGELRRIAVRLRHWDGNVDLVASRAMRRGHQTGPDGQTWLIDLQPGITGTYRLTLSGELPIEEVPVTALLPEVTVPEAATSEAWVAVVQPGLAFAVRGPLQPILQPAKSLPDWPKAAERLQRGGKAWKVVGPEWQVDLTPQGTSAGVRVLLCDRLATVVDHRRWLHEAVYWVAQETPGDLNVVFPADAHLLHVSVDGVELLPVQPGRRDLWLPLSARGGIRQVRLRWQYDPAEPLADPNLARLRLDSVADGPTLWTVQVPSGWEAVAARGSGSLGEGPTRIAAVSLLRAAMDVGLSRTLAKVGGEGQQGLAEAQHRFYVHCREASRALAVATDPDSTRVAGGRRLTEWLASLEKENRAAAREDHFELIATKAQRRAEAGEPLADAARAAPDESRLLGATTSPDSGTPRSWHMTPGLAPQVHLKRTDGARMETRMVEAGRWCMLLAAVWVVAMLPFLAGLAHRLWPELLVAVGLWGGALAGPTVSVLFLLLLGASGRVLILYRVLRRRLHRRAPSTSLHSSSLGA